MIWRVPSGLITMGLPVVAILAPAPIPVPVTFIPGATCALFGTVMLKLPMVVPKIALTLPVWFPVIASPRPTLVSELIPNALVLAVTPGGQGTWVQVNAEEELILPLEI